MAYLFFLHRAYPGCILLWLHSHTTSRWLVSIPLWWKGCVWLWSPFDISGSTVYSSCCLSQCCNFNVGESGGRSWTGSEIHWSLYQPKWIASLLLTMIFLLNWVLLLESTGYRIFRLKKLKGYGILRSSLMGLHQQNQSLESFKQFGLILIKKVCWNSKCLLHETEWSRCLLHETEWKTPWWSYLTVLRSLTEGFWF